MLPCGVPRDVGRAIEIVALHALTRHSAAAAPASAASAGGGHGIDRLRLAAQHLQETAGGIELDDRVRPAIHRPDVVLRVHPHRLREQESVDSGADFADVFAGGIELEQTRAAVREEARPAHGAVFSGARVDEDVALGIGGHTGRLAQMNVGRQLQKVDIPVEGNFRNLGRKQPARKAAKPLHRADEFLHGEPLFPVRVQNQFLHPPQLDFRDVRAHRDCGNRSRAIR